MLISAGSVFAIFGNVIRHQYASLSPSLIRNVVRDELPQLRLAIAAIRRDLEP